MAYIHLDKCISETDLYWLCLSFSTYPRPHKKIHEITFRETCEISEVNLNLTAFSYLSIIEMIT